MPISREERRRLYSAVRDARIRVVVDTEMVKNDAEAQVLTAIIKAYGKSPAGFIYHSPGRYLSSIRPPDVVLCHPDVGLLVIEAKKHGIDAIDGVEAGCIFVRMHGYVRPKNVIQQVQNQMFDIKADALKLIRKARELPLMSCMVAFPNIWESQWAESGYDKAHPSLELLFGDQCHDRSRLTKRIHQVVQEGMKRARRSRPLTDSHVDTLYRIFGKSAVINESRQLRAGVEEETLGGYVDEMMALDKYLSGEQEDLSRMMFEGSPRLVRGVAGSGKSVVLANIVARYLHRRLKSLDSPNLPELNLSIAVTCYNRALVEFLKRKIRAAFREQTVSAEVPANSVLITHFNGLLFALTRQRGWPINYIQIGIRNQFGADEWASRYRAQIRDFAKQNPEHYHAVCFDALFVDEGQDFEPEEFRLMLDLVRPNEITGEKPILIFYDDAQNLYGRARPVWKDVGINVLGDRSRPMRECFRNTRQIVELAFNVLLGSQAPSDQRVQTRTYADVSYLKERRIVEDLGDHVRVRFAEREYRVPEIREFPNEEAEYSWIADEIVRLIEDQQVRPEDILVVFHQPFLFNYGLLEQKVGTGLPNLQFVHPFGDHQEDKDRFILQPGCLTVSTVFGVKGYDAPIVFLAGTDRFGVDRRGRAAFYVAATRAKLQLYVTGVTGNRSLLDEARKVGSVL